MLEDQILLQLTQGYEELRQVGKLPTAEKLQTCYATFHDHFGPDQLALLDGAELLNRMHAHGSKDSLVYWLEFKNDDEFPDLFGSIAGGSALKFGIYKRQEDGQWMAGTGGAQQPITVAEAVAVARGHRDELIAASKVITEFTHEATDSNYAKLQIRISAAAPTVSDTVWGHKYLSLLHPTKLDDYHVEEFQRFYLRKMLQDPPSQDGRYAAAGRYVAAAAALRAPMNHLTSTLKSLYGRPYKVWRIGTKIGGTQSVWPMMRSQGCMAIGWASVGDLSDLPFTPQGRTAVREKLEATGHAPQSTNQLFNFYARIGEGDRVLAADGQQILGIGRVTGSYEYAPDKSAEAPHRRAVEWLDDRIWRLPESEGLQSTVRELKKYPQNLVAIERRLIESGAHPPSIGDDAPKGVLRSLPYISAQIQRILERKGQAILYGPPGTGKTHWAERTALELAARSKFGRNFEELDIGDHAAICSPDGLVRRCTFHPAYGYEDFIEGYRPFSGNGGGMAFELRDGIFKRLCKTAEANLHQDYYLLIDEINRGDIPRIFGELITLLELNKRGTPVELAVSRTPFSVPRNVYIIGTMNTADRSIALLDTALRRRFGFIELMPDTEVLGNAAVANSIPLGRWLAGLNDRIRKNVPRDARNLQVGHAYLMDRGGPVTDLGRFRQILAEDVFPLVEEYCYEDFRMLALVLGNAFVDVDAQRIRTELLAPDRQDDLVKALLEPWPELTTSKQAIEAARDTGETDDGD